MHGVTRFGKKGKLSHRYIGPYQISNRIGNIAYELDLPLEQESVHPMIQISLLKMFLGDHAPIGPTKSIGVNNNRTNEEIPV